MLQGIQDLLHAEWFVKKIVDSVLKSLFFIRFIATAGDHDDLGVWVRRFYLAYDCLAADPFHLQICNYRMELRFGQYLQCIFTTVDAMAFETVLMEISGQQLAYDDVVVDDENSFCPVKHNATLKYYYYKIFVVMWLSAGVSLFITMLTMGPAGSFFSCMSA